MRAFHDDPAIKEMLLTRCITSREAELYRQGGCHDEHDMQTGCATAVMLQTSHPRLEEFERLFGLSIPFASILEMLFETLPLDAAVFFPEYAVRAVTVGANTRSIGWQLLHKTLAEHEGADHRLVAATVSDALAFLAPLTAGHEVDIIDAREKMAEAGKTLKIAVQAVGYQEHPVWDAALIAKNALEAGATVCDETAGGMVKRAIKIATRTPEGALETARRMIELLAASKPVMARVGEHRMLRHAVGSEQVASKASGWRKTARMAHAQNKLLRSG